MTSWFTLGAGVCDRVGVEVVGASERVDLKVPYADCVSGFNLSPWAASAPSSAAGASKLVLSSATEIVPPFVWRISETGT